MDYRVISIGTLSSNEFWNEPPQTRTPHATCTLVRTGKRVILVDPSLPPQVISARLKERSGLEPSAVTDVFLTNFRPAHRWGLLGFEHATWHISETERQTVGVNLVNQLKAQDDPEIRKLIESDILLLRRTKAAPDKLAPQVDLFPLPGYTPGTCGLLLSFATATVLIAGDGVPTSEHLAAGRVLKGCFDANQAQESLLEAVEIADVIVPGHDNLTHNAGRRPAR